MEKRAFTKGFIALLLIVGAVGAAFAQTEIPAEVQSLFGDSFKAEKTVPKRIFAKALAQLLGVSLFQKVAQPRLGSNEVASLRLGLDEKCFKGLKKGDDANPSICGLKKTKVFTGKKTMNWKPHNKVTFEFAVKSLCRAGKWTKKKNWKTCSAYAKKHGFFASPMPEKPSKKKKITYGELALLMARSQQVSSSAVQAPPAPPPPLSTEIPELPETSLSFTPVSKKQIATNFFTNILLKNPLPNHFYKDEVYFLEGQLIGVTAEEIFVFICREGQGCENSIDFMGETTNSGAQFNISLHFQELGNFQIGIITGRSGQSRMENISVLPAPEVEEGGQAATELSVQYAEGKSTFSWNGNGNFTRLTLFQNEKRQDYLFRQGIKSFAPESKDFESFQKGDAFWLIAHDMAKSNLQPIKLTVQNFRKIETEEIQVKSLQEVYSGTPVAFTFIAKSLGPISKKAAFTLPSGEVEEINFLGNDLSAGKEFKIESTLRFSGTYIFEVNNPQGSAVVNVPIFVGTEIPLLPDYFTLHPPELNTAPLGNLDSARQEFLNLVNKDRRENSLLPVVLDNQLNAIAQTHSQNMVNQNFFGHVDPNGFSPEDRRKKAKYPASIRENLAKAGDLEGVERGLMGSPVHRAAILDPKMTRVGLGITKNEEGYFIATQNFSADPIFTSDLPGIEDSLFTKVSEKRAADSLSVIEHDASLRAAAKGWSARMQEGGFFGLSDSVGNTALKLARDQGIKSSLQIHIVKVSEKEQLSEELLKQTGLQDAENGKIGIGLAVSELGELYMTTFYTP